MNNFPNMKLIQAGYCVTPEKTLETVEAEIIFLSELRREYNSAEKRNYQFNLDLSIYLLGLLRDKIEREMSGSNHEELRPLHNPFEDFSFFEPDVEFSYQYNRLDDEDKAKANRFIVEKYLAMLTQKGGQLLRLLKESEVKSNGKAEDDI